MTEMTNNHPSVHDFSALLSYRIVCSSHAPDVAIKSKQYFRTNVKLFFKNYLLLLHLNPFFSLCITVYWFFGNFTSCTPILVISKSFHPCNTPQKRMINVVIHTQHCILPNEGIIQANQLVRCDVPLIWSRSPSRTYQMWRTQRQPPLC